MHKALSLFGCDTIVAVGKSTADGVTLFGKNSDREPNEAHHIVWVQPAVHPPGSRVKLTYIEIPQVEHTHGVLLAKPFWIWGAEMGVNDKGVAIGNEAVFTKAPYDKKPRLIGMDMLRLALERSASASGAVKVIIDLLEEFGQGGNCGYRHKLYYHNSFIIADPKEAFVLETAGRQWAMKKIKEVYSISNGLTIENDWDAASDDLVNYALDKGWCKSRRKFRFNECYSDFLYTKFSDCRKRRRRSLELLSAQKGHLTVHNFMKILRDHGDSPEFRPDKGITGATICMHAGFGPIRGSQTVGSMVSHLHLEHPVHFATGTAAPCTGIFKPLWIDAPPSNPGPAPQGAFDEKSLFWRHELLHRRLLDNLSHLPSLESQRDLLEAAFISDALRLSADDVRTRQSFSQRCFEQALNFEAQQLSELKNANDGRSPLHKMAWSKWNEEASLPK